MSWPRIPRASSCDVVARMWAPYTGWRTLMSSRRPSYSGRMRSRRSRFDERVGVAEALHDRRPQRLGEGDHGERVAQLGR